MSLNLELPKKTNIKPSISVIGVGGAGGNAVNNMISTGLDGIKFMVANTDAQSIDNSLSEHRIQLGETITQGLGAGSYPEVGKAAAEEAADTIADMIQDANMVFITAGMGGGTGTGATPVIARIAREQGLLTVAVVTKPFHFEGTHRMRVAELGLQELQKYVDTLVVIPNQNLFRVADKSTTFADAFKMADNVLSSGIRGITDLMVMPGLINLDFADIRSVMSEMGKAMIGAGEAEGENRAAEAAEAAISNPLLDNISMKGARGVLINITGGSDLTLFEVDEAANRIRDEVDPDANIIFGSSFDEAENGKIRVSIVATGIESAENMIQDGAKVAASLSSAAARGENSGGEPTAVGQGQQRAEASSLFSGGAAEEEPEQEAHFSTPDPVEPQLEPEYAAVQEREDGLSASEGIFAGQKADIGKVKSGLGFFGRAFSPKGDVDEQVEQLAQNAVEQDHGTHGGSEALVEEERELEFAGAQPEGGAQAGQKNLAASKAKEASSDVLDIPAFLRRKS